MFRGGAKLIEHSGNPWLDLVHCTKQAFLYKSVISELKRWRKDYQKFKVILSYLVRWRWAWATPERPCPTKQSKQNKVPPQGTLYHDIQNQKIHITFNMYIIRCLSILTIASVKASYVKLSVPRNTFLISFFSFLYSSYCGSARDNCARDLDVSVKSVTLACCSSDLHH